MKAKLSTIICLTLCLLLCSVAALAADHSTTATIDLIFDGMTFTDSIQVEWNERYPVPEGGVKWDGTDDFIGYADRDSWKIIDADRFSYASGQIAFMAKRDTSFYEVEQIAAKYDARIVMYMALTEDYVIELISDKSWQNMEAVIKELKNYEELLADTVIPHYVSYITSSAIPSDPWNNAEWDEKNPAGANWGIEAIRALSAWNYIDNMQELSVGIVDSSFDGNHNDIDYKALLDISNDQTSSHGTHVAGTSVAIHNTTGISGVFPKGNAVAVARNGITIELFGKTYTVQVAYWCDYKAFIGECLVRDARIINYSQGLNHYINYQVYGYKDKNESAYGKYESDSPEFIRYMHPFFNALEEMDMDFIFIQAAGNDGIDAFYSSEYQWITNEYFKDRFVVVGSVGLGNVFTAYSPTRGWGSNWGHSVDIVAPGENIYSAIRNNNFDYMSGTSMATPHVTGVAAMVWSVNPELTGPEVKDIILSHGESITATTNGGVRFVYPSLDAYASVQDALGIGTITGKVESNLIGLADIEIEMKNSGATATLVTDQNGFFTADLPVGTYTLCIDSENYEPIQRTVQIISGKDAEELVVLEGNGGNTNVGNFTCTVLDKNTQNPLNANVKLVPTNNSGVINVEGIGISGVMNIELDVGTYDLIVSMDGYYAHTEIVTISEDADVSVIIELEPTEAPEIKKGTLNGAVTLNSYGVSGIEVKVISGTSQVATLITDPNGQFATDLEPGAYVLSIDTDGYVPVSKNTTVFVGKTTTENIELDDSMYATVSYEEDNYQSWYEIILHNAKADTKHFKVTLSNKTVLFDTANEIRNNVIETAEGFRFPLDDELCTGAVLNVDAYSGQTHIYDGEIVMSPGALWNGSRKKLPDTHSFGGYWDKNGFYHSSDY